MFEGNPWLSIWVRPRKTIQNIISVNPNHRLGILACIYGFCSLMNLAQLYVLGYRFSLPVLLIGIVVFSFFWGYFLLTIFSWLIFKVGSWLKGAGSFVHIRAVAAWASVPLAINAIAWGLLIILFGLDLFKGFSGRETLSSTQMNTILTILLVKLAMSIVSLIIYLQGISIVHQFSISKAILNILIVACILAIFFVAVWIIIASSCGHFFDMPLVTFKT